MGRHLLDAPHPPGASGPPNRRPSSPSRRPAPHRRRSGRRVASGAYLADDGAMAPAASLTSVAPVFSTTDVAGWLAHYRALGFVTEPHDETYGFASRGEIELHVSLNPDHDPARTAACAFVAVDDADALAKEWARVKAGRTVAPVDTDYGIREGAHIDPNGNLIRFGSRR